MSTTLETTDIVDAAGLHELRLQNPSTCLVDVRTGGEFEAVHIPGSFNVPLDALGEHARDLADLKRPVVLVCQSGARASEAQQKLRRAGSSAVHVLDGGIASWQASGGNVTHGHTTRWAMDRQVRFVAGTIALTGIGLSTVVPGAKWIAGFIGAGLTFSAVSNTCAMGTMLGKLPYNRSDSYDLKDVVAKLKAA